MDVSSRCCRPDGDSEETNHFTDNLQCQQKQILLFSLYASVFDSQARSRHTFLLLPLLLDVDLAVEEMQTYQPKINKNDGDVQLFYRKFENVVGCCLPLFFREILSRDFRCLFPDVRGAVRVFQLVHVHVERHGVGRR